MVTSAINPGVVSAPVSSSPLTTNRQVIDQGVSQLHAIAKHYSEQRLHGEVSLTVTFVDGVAVQWEQGTNSKHRKG